jgi:hypothetical protein
VFASIVENWCDPSPRGDEIEVVDRPIDGGFDDAGRGCDRRRGRPRIVYVLYGVGGADPNA